MNGFLAKWNLIFRWNREEDLDVVEAGEGSDCWISDLAGLIRRRNQQRLGLLIPLLGFNHGGFGAWWVAWIGENDGQHSISPLCVLWNSDRWWWLWFPSSPYTTTSRHQGSLLDLSLYLFFSWTHPLSASFFDPWWCKGFGLFNGSKYIWVVVEIWL